jgi:hypothetical protein
VNAAAWRWPPSARPPGRRSARGARAGAGPERQPDPRLAPLRFATTTRRVFELFAAAGVPVEL